MGPRSEICTGNGDPLQPEMSDASHLISARHSSTMLRRSLLPQHLLTMPPRRPPPPESIVKRMLKLFNMGINKVPSLSTGLASYRVIEDVLTKSDQHMLDPIKLHPLHKYVGIKHTRKHLMHVTYAVYTLRETLLDDILRYISWLCRLSDL